MHEILWKKIDFDDIDESKKRILIEEILHLRKKIKKSLKKCSNDY
jgi:hypothetical protein